MRFIRLIILFFICIGFFYSCKKQDQTSANQITFSLNDSAMATCKTDIRPDFDYLGTSNCELNVDRVGTFKTGESAEIGIFEEYNCDLVHGQLPYQTKNFRMTIIYYQTPADPIAYSYDRGTYWPDTSATVPGSLLLTITERSSHRLKGTVNGTIYRTNVGQNLIPASLSSSFDLSIPLVP